MTEEKIELMPVAEAVALANKKAITIQDVAKNIKARAESGGNCMRYFDIVLPFDVIRDVMAAGYNIRLERGMLGENISVISW